MMGSINKSSKIKHFQSHRLHGSYYQRTFSHGQTQIARIHVTRENIITLHLAKAYQFSSLVITKCVFLSVYDLSIVHSSRLYFLFLFKNSFNSYALYHLLPSHVDDSAYNLSPNYMQQFVNTIQTDLIGYFATWGRGNSTPPLHNYKSIKATTNKLGRGNYSLCKNVPFELRNMRR